MRTSLVLTVIGDDRPGLVEQLSAPIVELGANWEESRMARLAGKFAGLLRVSVDADRADALAARLTSLRGDGLTVVVERSAAADAPAVRIVRLEMVGNDRPGIVRDIAHALARQQVNIDDLETDVISAPMSGDALFRASATLRVPASVTVGQLRQVLEAIADELMVDLTLEDAPPAGHAAG